MICIALLSPTLQALTVENKGDHSQESLNSSRCDPGFQIKAFHLNSTQFQLQTFSYRFAGTSHPCSLQAWAFLSGE